MDVKRIAIIGAIALLAVAIAMRGAAVRAIVIPAPPAA